MVILDIIEGSPDHGRRSSVLRRLKNEDTVLQSTSRGDNRVLTYIMSEFITLHTIKLDSDIDDHTTVLEFVGNWRSISPASSEISTNRRGSGDPGANRRRSHTAEGTSAAEDDVGHQQLVSSGTLETSYLSSSFIVSGSTNHSFRTIHPLFTKRGHETDGFCAITVAELVESVLPIRITSRTATKATVTSREFREEVRNGAEDTRNTVNGTGAGEFIELL